MSNGAIPCTNPTKCPTKSKTHTSFAELGKCAAMYGQAQGSASVPVLPPTPVAGREKGAASLEALRAGTVLAELGRKEQKSAAEYLEASTSGAATIVLSACPDATAIEWAEDGGGEDPGRLELSIVCPHAGDGNDDYVYPDDFAEAHGLAYDAFDGVGFGLQSGVMRYHADDLGITGSEDEGFRLDLTQDPARFARTVAKFGTSGDQVGAYIDENPMPEGRDAVREWENEFLDVARLPEGEQGDVVQYAMQHANEIERADMEDPEFLEAWSRNEYMLSRLRAVAGGQS